VSERASYSEGAAFGLVSFALVAVIGVGGSIVIARIYGIEVVGAYALAYAPVGICGTLSTLQEQAAFVRETAVLPARAPRITGLFAAVLAFSTGLTLLVATITGVVAYLVLSGPIGQPELVVPAIVLLVEYVLLSNTSWNLDMVFSAFRAGRHLLWVRLLLAVVYLGSAIGLSFVFDSVWGLVLAQVAAAVISLAARIVAVRTFMRLAVRPEVIRDGMRSFPEILRFGAKVAPTGVADGISVEASTWILGVTSSLPAVGAWTRAWQLSRRLLDPTYRIVEVLFPTLVERRASGDHRGFDGALLQSSRLMGSALLFPAAVAGGAADGVMDLFGPGFDRAAPAFALLLLVPAAYCVTSLMSQALIALNRPATASKLSVIRMLLLIALGIPLAIWLDITGMALATLAAYAVGVALSFVIMRPHLVTQTRGLLFRRSVAVAAGAYTVGFAAARAVDAQTDGLLGLVAAMAAGSIAFLAVFVLAGGPTPADRARVTILRARLTSRRQPTPQPVPPVHPGPGGV
jgi:O-antigen/teichoic acid export membrane protein